MIEDNVFDAAQMALMCQSSDFSDIADRPLTLTLVRELECLHREMGELLGRLRKGLRQVPD